MTAQVGKYAANRLLRKHMKGYENKKVETGDDPYFAMIEDPRRPGKLKKVKKQIPAYIPEHDANVLASVRRKAYRLDMCLFNFMGIRFGWEAVIGIIPLIGDTIGVFFALLVLRKCMEIEGGLGPTLQMRMVLNIAVDFAVGLVPFIGDLADAAFKCNTRNLRLLEHALDKKYKPQPQRRDERDLVGVDKEKRRRNRQSGIYAPQDPPPATAFADFSDDELQEHEHHPAGGAAQPPPPAPAQDRSRMSWFSGGKKQKNPPPPQAAQGVQPAHLPPLSVQETGTVQR